MEQIEGASRNLAQMFGQAKGARTSRKQEK
jgi:hypothetical protein